MQITSLNPNNWPDPDEIGQSEYRAIHELASDVWDSADNRDETLEERRDLVLTSLKELYGYLRTIMSQYKALPVEEPCRYCGEPCDDGEGFDGMCGNCADRTDGSCDHCNKTLEDLDPKDIVDGEDGAKYCSQECASEVEDDEEESTNNV